MSSCFRLVNHSLEHAPRRKQAAIRLTDVTVLVLRIKLTFQISEQVIKGDRTLVKLTAVPAVTDTLLILKRGQELKHSRSLLSRHQYLAGVVLFSVRVIEFDAILQHLRLVRGGFSRSHWHTP